MLTPKLKINGNNTKIVKLDNLGIVQKEKRIKI